MSEMSSPKSHYGLENHGLRNLGTVHWNLSTPTLIEHALKRQEGKVSKDGALVVCTGQHTGRSANDKFVVLDETTEDDIWWGKVNAPYEPARFDALFERMMAHLEGSELYVQDCYVGADPEHRLQVRISTNLPGTAFWPAICLLKPLTSRRPLMNLSLRSSTRQASPRTPKSMPPAQRHLLS